MYPKARHDRIRMEIVGDELRLWDEVRQQSHHLDRPAALIWQHCDGETSIVELADLLHRELDLPWSTDLVWQTLDRLAEAGLLVDYPGTCSVGLVQQIG